MKKFISACAIVACLGLAAIGQTLRGGVDGFYFVKSLVAPAGSLVVTNNMDDVWYFDSIAYRLPPSTTNTFTVKVQRPVSEAVSQSVVTTNIFGAVSTSVYVVGWSVTSVATQTLASVSTTNAQSVVITGDSIARYSLRRGDIIQYGFSCGTTQRLEVVGRR